MGKSHRDDRHRRERDRSRSRDRHGRRHYDDDRRHSSKSSHKSSETKSKDVSKGIEAVKSHMRSALDSALAGTSGQFTETETTEVKMTDSDFGLTVVESATRHREIERIEDDAFRPSIFKSTAGGAGGRIKKEDLTDRFAVVDKKQDAHDKAMFGPKWRDPVKQEKPEENEETAEPFIPEAKKEVELAGTKAAAAALQPQPVQGEIFNILGHLQPAASACNRLDLFGAPTLYIAWFRLPFGDSGMYNTIFDALHAHGFRQYVRQEGSCAE